MFKTMRGWLRGFGTAVLVMLSLCFLAISVSDNIRIINTDKGPKKYVL